MKRLLSVIIVIASALTINAEDLVRNPFWPQGYQGRRYPITETPRYPTVVPTATTDEASEEDAVGDAESNAGTNSKTDAKGGSTNSTINAVYTSEDAENALWRDARTSVKTSDVCTFKRKGKKVQAIRINGRLYSTGDLISINHGTRRFTWIVLGVNKNGSLRLQRVRHRELTQEELNGQQPAISNNQGK